MNYEDTLFVYEIEVHISRYGGIITRELFPSDGDCKKEKRYVIHDLNHWSSHWAMRFNSSISDECRFAGLEALPKFKDDGFYRFYDDAELVLNAYLRLYRWLRSDALKLNKKQLKRIESQWSHRLNQKVSHQDWVKIKASMNGINVKKRSDLSQGSRDLIESRDYVK